MRPRSGPAEAPALQLLAQLRAGISSKKICRRLFSVLATTLPPLNSPALVAQLLRLGELLDPLLQAAYLLIVVGQGVGGVGAFSQE